MKNKGFEIIGQGKVGKSSIEDLDRGIILRNENGYPLLEDGSIDWDQTSKEKLLIEQQFKEPIDGKKKFKKVDERFTKPKKRRK